MNNPQNVETRDQRKIYREDGGKFLVEVLKSWTDDRGMEVTLLRCLHTLRPSPVFGTISDGEEFDVSVRPGYEPYCGWHLSEVTDLDIPENFGGWVSNKSELRSGSGTQRSKWHASRRSQ